MIVTMSDVRSIAYCSRGTRQWFESKGLDWSDFLQNGVDAEKLIQTGDPMALAIVEQVRARNGRQQETNNRL